MYPSGSPGRIMREIETGHCSGDTVNLEIPDKYWASLPLSAERFLLHWNQIRSFGLYSFWSPKFGDAAMNPKGRVGSQMYGGQSQIPTYLISLFSSGHLTDSECNQKLPSKKGSLIERKRSSGRVRRKGDEPQASGYHSEGKPPCRASLSFFTLSHFCHTSACGFFSLLKALSFSTLGSGYPWWL